MYKSDHFGELVRETRRKLGLSQVKLAALSGVSLPTIQNLEAGNKGGAANPSINTLEKLFLVLGLSLRIDYEGVNWDLLAILGVPISEQSRVNKLKGSQKISSAEKLIQTLPQACLEIMKSSASDNERKKEAVQALLLALETHYPSFYKKHFSIPVIKEIKAKKLTGRLVKLRRISLAILKEYL